VGADLQSLGRRLVGQWTTEATHPAFPGTVIAGSNEFEWLDGDQFLIFRSHYDHPDFPDAISIIGDTDGLRMHYFDSRGVHRLYEVTLADDGWTVLMDRNAPDRSFAPSTAPFSQRLTYTIGDGDQEISGTSQLCEEGETWTDDLAITLRRTSEQAGRGARP
jgi:hypothetical protein